jgi:hypothetical protein
MSMGTKGKLCHLKTDLVANMKIVVFPVEGYKAVEIAFWLGDRCSISVEIYAPDLHLELN